MVRRAPEELHRSFQDAFNRHDPESVVALYEPEAVLVTLGGAARGTDAILETYRNVFAKLPTIELHTLDVNRAGDLAMLHGRWILSERGEDGTVVERNGRNTETARQQSDGRWLFVIDVPSAPTAKEK